MEDEPIIIIVAIVCATIFGSICVLVGIDGMLAASIVAGIFGVVGYKIKGYLEKKNGETTG